MSILISIVEDDPGIRDSLVRVLNRAAGIKCLASYSTAEEALRGLPEAKPPPDIVLMDINLPGMNGVDCVKKLKARLPSVQIMMVTVYENPEQIFEALAAGATGYILKQTPPAKLLEAIAEMHRGGAPMSSQIARKVVISFQTAQPSGEASTLSPREQEILAWLAKGYLIKEIADPLGIGFDTVRSHIRRIYEKLQVHSRAQAVAKYVGTTPKGRFSSSSAKS
jgi:DNA-binding NarL/FixJ family response regulator